MFENPSAPHSHLPKGSKAVGTQIKAWGRADIPVTPTNLATLRKHLTFCPGTG